MISKSSCNVYTDAEVGGPHSKMNQAMARSTAHPRKLVAAIQRYGLALLSVAIALAAGLFLANYNFQGVADPLFLFAIAISVWYGGLGPAILAMVLSGLADSYFFIPPLYSLTISGAEIPHFVIFLLFAWMLTWF